MWPRLTLDEWAPTQTTLHRWTQMVGKTRLALAPMQNHWWQVVLYVTERGLTTSPIPYDGRTFDISFDFTGHKLIARTSDGWWPGTVGSPVAEPAFYAYSYPEPAGCDVAPVRPDGAYYHPVMHEWILTYESVRTSPDPEGALLEFFQSTYEAAANLAKWDRAALERPAGWKPPPSSRT